MNDQTHSERMKALQDSLMYLVAEHVSWLDAQSWKFACDAIGIGYFENYSESRPQTNMLERLYAQIKQEWPSQTLDEAKIKLRQLDWDRTISEVQPDGTALMTVYSNLGESLRFTFDRSELD